MTRAVEKEFDAAMMVIFHRALNEAKYRATRFHQMLCEHPAARG
jgi:hypothetical protein